MLRTWYFAANVNGLRHGFDQIRAAVLSARDATTLRPVMLVDDEGADAEAAAALAWLDWQGVTVIRRTASLFPLVRARFGEQADVFSGHWLRCDIPVLETSDEFVLYTDIDVMFRKDVSATDIRPSSVACAPEHRIDDFSYFNSGVMVMNLPALRRTRDRFVATLQERLSNMAAHDDQGVFNVCYRACWERLPNTWNWKPYWGWNDEAAIVHFHGPKPSQVEAMLAGDEERFGTALAEIFRRDRDAYRRYLAVFQEVSASEAAAVD